jgi:hypothetical protein
MAEIELLVSGLGSVGGGNDPSYKNDENGRGKRSRSLAQTTLAARLLQNLQS